MWQETEGGKEMRALVEKLEEAGGKALLRETHTLMLEASLTGVYMLATHTVACSGHHSGSGRPLRGVGQRC